MSVVAGGVSSQAGLASFSPRPRPTQVNWERMLADEHARGLHTEICGCNTIQNRTGAEQ